MCKNYLHTPPIRTKKQQKQNRTSRAKILSIIFFLTDRKYRVQICIIMALQVNFAYNNGYAALDGKQKKLYVHTVVVNHSRIDYIY